MEAVHDPGIVFLQLEHTRPGGIRFHSQGFFVGLEVDRSASPGVVRERTPFGRDQWRVVTIFSRAHHAGMLIQFERNFGFERQACAFEDDFWTEFASHSLAVYLIVFHPSKCYTLRKTFTEYRTPGPNGLQLGAVEYIVPAEPWDAENDELPQLMGQHFHLNENLGVYVLHAWIWMNNSAGIFEDWNPAVSCPE